MVVGACVIEKICVALTELERLARAARLGRLEWWGRAGKGVKVGEMVWIWVEWGEMGVAKV